jgi:hypothetical protein
MKTIKKTKLYAASPEVVFDRLEDLGVTGMHMTKSSAMMMGSKLNLQYLSTNKKGPAAKYRWTGAMLGLKMDFTVVVTRWIAGKEKTWETLRPAKMIIYSWYRMHLKVRKIDNQTRAELSITYEKPKGFWYKLLCFFFADWYCRWCLSNMLIATEKALRQTAIIS